MKEFNGYKVCPKCHANNPSSSVFCSNCGNKLADNSGNNGTQCPSCHHPLAPGTDFCPYCGASLKQAPQTPVYNGGQQQYQQFNQQQQYNQQQPPYGQPAPQKQQSTFGLICTIVLAILIAVLIMSFC